MNAPNPDWVVTFLNDAGIPRNYHDLKLSGLGSQAESMLKVIKKPDWFDSIDNLFIHNKIDNYELGFAIIRAIKILHNYNRAYCVSVVGLVNMMANISAMELKKGTTPFTSESYLTKVFEGADVLYISDFGRAIGEENSYSSWEQHLIEDYITYRIESGLKTLFYSPWQLSEMEGVWTPKFLRVLDKNTQSIEFIK